MAEPPDDDTSPWPPRPPQDVLGAAPPAPPSPAPTEPASTSARPAVTSPLAPPASARTGGWDGARVAGIILVLVGIFLLLRRFVPLDSGLLLPVVALVIGGALVLGALRPRGRNG